MAEGSPNILLVMADQFRFDALGAVGGWTDTPNLDRIAGEGVRFAATYTNSPVCVPARVSLATGRYPHHTGVWGNRPYTIPANAPTWMRSVRDAGYVTSVFGKTHLHRHGGDLRDQEPLLRELGLDHVNETPGFHSLVRTRCHLTEAWKEAGVRALYRRDIKRREDEDPWVVRPSPLPLDLYPDVYIGRMAQEYLQHLDDTRPWMCFVSFCGPHEPFDAPEEYARRVDSARVPPALEAVETPHRRPKGIFDRRPRYPLRPQDVSRLRADYAASVALIDDQIGQILEVIDDRGELDRTVIVFISDHGEMAGDFGMLHKQNFTDPSVRVPFLLRVPGGPAGVVRNDPVELMDVGATLVDVAGGPPVPGTYGRSVLPQLAGPDEKARTAAMSEYQGEYMLVTQRWKIAVNKRGLTYMLFDLENDPHETRNLAGDPEHKADDQRLRDRLLRRIVQTARDPDQESDDC